MPISFEKIGQYLHYLSEVHGVQFCIKDFCGFVAINKLLDETLRPFLAHTNPFCMLNPPFVIFSCSLTS